MNEEPRTVAEAADTVLLASDVPEGRDESDSTGVARGSTGASGSTTPVWSCGTVDSSDELLGTGRFAARI